MKELINKAKTSHELEKEQIISLLENNNCNQELFSAADEVRKKYVGDEVHLRALIEFSNVCKNNCLYCGLRKDNKNLHRYTLEPEEIIETANNAAKLGFKTVVLQSGENNVYDAQTMAKIIQEIKSLNLALTLSIGEKTEEEYCLYKDAGADRYLLRIETTDKNLYEKLNPQMSFENRLKCLENIKKAGFERGTGIMAGLPEQTTESLADDILFFRELDADMIGIGPFIAHEDTPLKNKNNKDAFVLSLKVTALTRLLLPDINIPATTAMETLNPRGRIIALQSGANVVMPNVTDVQYRKHYELYKGKSLNNNIEEQIISIGRTLSQEYGFRKKQVKS